MKSAISAIVFALLFAAFAGAADEKTHIVHFTKSELGKIPLGWKVDRTGKGDGSEWKVVEDKTAPSGKGYALAQTSESPKSMFNLCVLEEPKYKNVQVIVAFEAIAGKNDQGGGIVWRYQDHDNYYIARMNPLEDNFRVYKVVAGKRMQLQTADVKVPAREWHTLRIEMVGDSIACYLDDKKYLEAKDSTFKDAGKVGLWTKSDAQTRFDDFKVTAK